jgi:adenylate kinase family enzyme
VIGGPGSGKGVLCDRLIEDAGIKHYSSGESLREEVASGSFLGKSIESLLKEGKLVPSTTMIALLKKQIGKFPGSLLALDGFPRTLQNYSDFDEICGAPECAIYIDVPDEVMIERILNRGKSGSGRSDDNLETAKMRIETFHQLTEPTIECLHESGIPVHTLDGTGTPDDVWKQLLELNTPIRRHVKDGYVINAPFSSKS